MASPPLTAHVETRGGGRAGGRSRCYNKAPFQAEAARGQIRHSDTTKPPAHVAPGQRGGATGVEPE